MDTGALGIAAFLEQRHVGAAQQLDGRPGDRLRHPGGLRGLRPAPRRSELRHRGQGACRGVHRVQRPGVVLLAEAARGDQPVQPLPYALARSTSPCPPGVTASTGPDSMYQASGRAGTRYISERSDLRARRVAAKPSAGRVGRTPGRRGSARVTTCVPRWRSVWRVRGLGCPGRHPEMSSSAGMSVSPVTPRHPSSRTIRCPRESSSEARPAAHVSSATATAVTRSDGDPIVADGSHRSNR